jgi:hypothetical protein
MWQGRELSYFSRGRRVRNKPQARAAFHPRLNCLSSRATHTILCHAPAFLESMQQQTILQYQFEGRNFILFHIYYNIHFIIYFIIT